MKLQMQQKINMLMRNDFLKEKEWYLILYATFYLVETFKFLGWNALENHQYLKYLWTSVYHTSQVKKNQIEIPVKIPFNGHTYELC